MSKKIEQIKENLKNGKIVMFSQKDILNSKNSSFKGFFDSMKKKKIKKEEKS